LPVYPPETISKSHGAASSYLFPHNHYLEYKTIYTIIHGQPR